MFLKQWVSYETSKSVFGRSGISLKIWVKYVLKMHEIYQLKWVSSYILNEWIVILNWLKWFLETSEICFQFEWNMFFEISAIETSSNVSIIDLIFKAFSLWIQIYKNIQNWSFHSKDIYHPNFHNEIKWKSFDGERENILTCMQPAFS